MPGTNGSTNQVPLTTVGANNLQPVVPAPVEPTISAENFAPPRSKSPWIVGLALLAACALIVWMALARPQPEHSQASTPSPTTSSEPAWGNQFVLPYSDLGGRWEIVEYEWSATGLELQLRVAADRGPFRVEFRAYHNATTESFFPAPSTRSPTFPYLMLQTGEEQSGWLNFPMTRGDATIILCDEYQEQASALLVNG
jgi:hypothetical protein